MKEKVPQGTDPTRKGSQWTGQRRSTEPGNNANAGPVVWRLPPIEKPWWMWRSTDWVFASRRPSVCNAPRPSPPCWAQWARQWPARILCSWQVCRKTRALLPVMRSTAKQHTHNFDLCYYSRLSYDEYQIAHVLLSSVSVIGCVLG